MFLCASDRTSVLKVITIFSPLQSIFHWFDGAGLIRACGPKLMAQSNLRSYTVLLRRLLDRPTVRRMNSGSFLAFEVFGLRGLPRSWLPFL